MMPIRVPDALARNRSCVVINTAAPASRILASSVANSLAAVGSRPDVGSSSSSTSACLASAIARPDLLPHAL